ncbi:MULTISPECIES: hypothetical protein [Streptomyces]|uniref:hypothetical protein n=1 Tax=Streptomyces TaxID=1883 RepID=UPI0006AF9C16|nr:MULTISPECIES: hypothetical protein [Streptomyces]KOU43551.1 hypothetical protein ADK54_17255 [Streptomyces sp. WM6378]GGU39358.1 hypothetical protein GCM10010289_70360 [Streptomyces violascens]
MGGDNALVTWILAVVGSLFAAVLAVRAFGHWFKKEWGALISHIVGGAVVAVMIFTPTLAVTILKSVGAKIASVFTG